MPNGITYAALPLSAPYGSVFLPGVVRMPATPIHYQPALARRFLALHIVGVAERVLVRGGDAGCLEDVAVAAGNPADGGAEHRLSDADDPLDFLSFHFSSLRSSRSSQASS